MASEQNTVFYRFNSSNVWSQVQKLTVITLKDLEKHITKSSSVGECHHTNKEVSCSCQFLLSFYNEESGKELTNRSVPLNLNSHVIVRRRPINTKNIKPIDKKLVLRRHREAKEKRARELERIKSKEIASLERKKRDRVQKRLAQLEEERWQKASALHKKEVEKIKKGLKNSKHVIKNVKKTKNTQNVKNDRKIGKKEKSPEMSKTRLKTDIKSSKIDERTASKEAEKRKKERVESKTKHIFRNAVETPRYSKSFKDKRRKTNLKEKHEKNTNFEKSINFEKTKNSEKSEKREKPRQNIKRKCQKMAFNLKTNKKFGDSSNERFVPVDDEYVDVL